MSVHPFRSGLCALAWGALALALTACGSEGPQEPQAEATSGAPSSAAEASEPPAAPFDWADIRWGIADVPAWCEVEHRFVDEVPEPVAEIRVEGKRVVLGERELAATPEGLVEVHAELQRLLADTPRTLKMYGNGFPRQEPVWSSTAALRVRALPDAHWSTLVRVVCLTASGALRVQHLEIVLEPERGDEPEFRILLALRLRGYEGPHERIEVLVGASETGHRAWRVGPVRTRSLEEALEVLDRWSQDAAVIEAPESVRVAELRPWLARFADGPVERFAFRAGCSPDFATLLRGRREPEWGLPSLGQGASSRRGR